MGKTFTFNSPLPSLRKQTICVRIGFNFTQLMFIQISNYTLSAHIRHANDETCFQWNSEGGMKKFCGIIFVSLKLFDRWLGTWNWKNTCYKLSKNLRHTHEAQVVSNPTESRNWVCNSRKTRQSCEAIRLLLCDQQDSELNLILFLFSFTCSQ